MSGIFAILKTVTFFKKIFVTHLAKDNNDDVSKGDVCEEGVFFVPLDRGDFELGKEERIRYCREERERCNKIKTKK